VTQQKDTIIPWRGLSRMSYYTVTDVWSTSVGYSSERVKICLFALYSVRPGNNIRKSDCRSTALRNPHPPPPPNWKSRSGLKNKRHANHRLQNYIDSNQSIFTIITQTINGSGRVVAQAVSRCWLPTAAARVRVRPESGVCGGQSGIGAGFLRVLRLPLPIIPPISPSS
jgi:hypothetical protein